MILIININALAYKSAAGLSSYKPNCCVTFGVLPNQIDFSTFAVRQRLIERKGVKRPQPSRCIFEGPVNITNE